MALPPIETPVLVVGGSLVGMSAAVFLGHHGVRPIVVEHHRGTAIHPRAALITQRSMEAFRSLGIERIIREESERQFVQDGAVMAVETLAGKELAWFIANLNDGVRDVSPTLRLFITQKLLEPLLQKRAQELGADLRFATEMISFEQDATGVTADVRRRDTGETYTIRARYMIAADGPRSQVRERLRIPIEGRGILSNSITIYFRAPLAPLLRGRNLSVILVSNPVLRGFFRIEKPFETGFLVVNTTGDPAHPNEDLWTGLTNKRCTEYLRAALGDDSIPLTIDDVMKWNARADVAARFRDGRVFLAGDAAHVMPPYGGYGGNVGIQDAHALAWKLAYVLRGSAGDELLSTYEAERRPVAFLTTEQAYTRYVTREARYLDRGNLQPQVDDLNVEMGYLYHSSAVVPEANASSSTHGSPRESGGRPGSRAPHLWLEPGVSTLDLFGRNFSLLTGREGRSWVQAAEFAAQRLSTPLDVHQIGHAGFCESHGISGMGAVLVRPDGFIAWRKWSAGNSPEVSLVQALATVLHRRHRGSAATQLSLKENGSGNCR
jgi:2-polyprenyl-6-methoxyphenol hydroxylase-like FAD-dependent oxidoreductase